MRVLYIGQLNAGGTCLARALALREHGWDVHHLDTLPYINYGGRLRRGLQHRLNWGPDVMRLNRDIQARATQIQGLDAVWLDKARWVVPQTLATLKSLGVLLAHYTPDPAFTVHQSRLFSRSVALYDLCITTKQYEMEHYRQLGARQVVFNWQGVDHRFSECTACEDITSSKRHGVAFIGHRETHYERVLGQVAQANLPLSIWGNGWPALQNNQTPIAGCIRGAGVWGTDYTTTLASAQVGVGLLSKYCPDDFTTRTFEIPAAGQLLLGERTASHEQLFVEGQEAEFFTTSDELVTKLRYYLANDAERVRLAKAGRRKVLEQYQWPHVLSPSIAALEALHHG